MKCRQVVCSRKKRTIPLVAFPMNKKNTNMRTHGILRNCISLPLPPLLHQHNALDKNEKSMIECPKYSHMAVKSMCSACLVNWPLCFFPLPFIPSCCRTYISCSLLCCRLHLHQCFMHLLNTWKRKVESSQDNERSNCGSHEQLWQTWVCQEIILPRVRQETVAYAFKIKAYFK